MFSSDDGKDQLIEETTVSTEEIDPMERVELIENEPTNAETREVAIGREKASETAEAVSNGIPEAVPNEVDDEELDDEEPKTEEPKALVTPKPAKKPVSNPVVAKKTKNELKIDKIVKIARSKLGKPFRVAGTTDKGYDCSGLIMTAYRKQNITLPRASYNMVKKGWTVSLKNVKKGDLLFFATKSNKPKQVSHVGMVTKVKNGKIYFIHSFEKHGVIENTMDEGYYRKRFVKARRYLR